MDLLAFLSPEALAALDARAPGDLPRARHLLRRIGSAAGSVPLAVPFLEQLLAALPECADPEWALLNLERWTAALPTPANTLALLRDDPRLLADLLGLFGASRYLSDILVREPWLYALLTEGAAPREQDHFRTVCEAAVRPLLHPERRADALRRVMRREILRIGWRDLARRAPLEDVTRELSDLADAIVEAALQLAREEADPREPASAAAVRFAVVATGKLGARELDYSSDIELLFVMDADGPADPAHERYAHQLAEALVRVLAEDTEEGRCFRVHLPLRPVSGAGALVCSVASLCDPGKLTPEAGEPIARMKCRPVAGDRELGGRFLQAVARAPYSREHAPTLLEIEGGRRATVEARPGPAGEWDGFAQEGCGMARNIEAAVQLFFRCAGTRFPDPWLPDTLTALALLESAQTLSPGERRLLEEGYRFFRAAEHRLQLMDDPPDPLEPVAPGPPAALRRLSRLMGYATCERFLAELREHTAAVCAWLDGSGERLTAHGPT